MAGCSKDGVTNTVADVVAGPAYELVPDASSQPGSDADSGEMIYDAVIEDAATRSASPLTGTELPEGASFTVYATQERSDKGRSVLIDGTTEGGNTVTYRKIDLVGGWGWRTEGVYYWPVHSYTVHVYGLYGYDGANPATMTLPVISSSDLATKDDPVVTFDGATHKLDSGVDLLWTHAEAHRESRTKKDNYPLDLTFRHVLAQVSFSGRLATSYQAAGWRVYVKSLAIRNVNMAGELHLKTGVFTPTVDGDDYPTATTDYTFRDDEETEITGEARELAATAGDVAILMPQTPVAWRNSPEYGETIVTTKGCYLELDCHVTDGSTDLWASDAAFQKVYVPFGEPLAGGRRQTFTLNFGCGYDANGVPAVRVIDISTTITPWTVVEAGSQEAWQPQS